MATVFGNTYTYADITFIPIPSDIPTIRNKDIIQGGMSINSYSSNSDYLEVGNATTSELSVILENADGRWDDVDFIGKTCMVNIYCFPDSGDLLSDKEVAYQNRATITSTDIVVTRTILSIPPVTIPFANFVCQNSGEGSGYIPPGDYKISVGESDLVSLKVTILNGDEEVYSTTLNGTSLNVTANTGYTYKIDVIWLKNVVNPGTYPIDFGFTQSSGKYDLGYFIIDESTYSRGRVTLKGLDKMSTWDVQPKRLLNYSKPGFRIYSSGVTVFSSADSRATPIGTTIASTTTATGAYTIAEVATVLDSVEFGKSSLWFRLTSTNMIKNTRNQTVQAGDSAWVSPETTEGEMYPVTSGVEYKAQFGISTPFATLKQLINMEIQLSDMLRLDDASLELLDTVTVNYFKMGNQFSVHQLIAWAAGILGKGVTMSQSEATFKWYDMIDNFLEIDDSDAYDYMYQPKELTVTGLSMTVGGETYTEGTSDYVISLGNNAVTNAITSIVRKDETLTPQEYVTALYNEWSFDNPMIYSPMEATILQYPYNALYSVAQWTGRDGYNRYSPITDWTWQLNGATKLRSRGSYLKSNPSPTPSGGGSSGGGGSSIFIDSELSTTSTNPVQNKVITEALTELPYAGSETISGSAIRSAGIPFATVDSTSTATAFTATVEGIVSLYDGVCMWLKNGVVTSASGFTLNINGLGAKPVYTNLAAATRDTTIFNVAYTMLFVYDTTRVSGGCWICYRGYDANTNTIGYQLRTNSMSLPASDKAARYRIWLTSADGSHFVPINTSTATDATTARTLNTRPIDPFGEIFYNATNGSVNAAARPAVTTLWQQYVFAIGYSYVMTLTAWKPVYLKCTPQADGSAVMEDIVQALPTTADGKIYIFLGVAYSTTNMELLANHPVYYHDGKGIRAWTGTTYIADADLSDKLSQLGIVPQQIFFDTTANWNAQTSLESQENTVYVYTDYQTSEGAELAGIKIGDGHAYVVDLPFIDKLYKQHIENSTIHITQTEREFWNNKNRAYMSLTDPETMILTVN